MRQARDFCAYISKNVSKIHGAVLRQQLLYISAPTTRARNLLNVCDLSLCKPAPNGAGPTRKDGKIKIHKPGIGITPNPDILGRASF